ncbi:hypothetical protein AB0O76_10870 [Streptomyces sp. NPDC086554]|uniref:hypothetical protein n=1 Tax=Streptomyces sp. NPDC086554 TaxID=3154864 RepID=UPI003439F84F
MKPPTNADYEDFAAYDPADKPRGIDTRRPPAWLARLLRGTPPAPFHTAVAVVAFTVGAMISTVISQWLVLPGIALALALLWFIAMLTNQRLWPMASFIFATAALVLLGLFLVQDKVLDDRGRTVGGVVVDTSQEGDRTSCRVRFDDGRVAEGPMGGCRGTGVGERIRLYVDPEGEVGASNTAPDVALWLTLAAAANVAFTASVTWSAAIGIRRERARWSWELSHTPLPHASPPPPPPPPGPR